MPGRAEPGREAGGESASRGEGPALQGAEGTLDFILNVLKNYGRLLKYLCFERIPLAPGCGQRRVDGEDQSGGRSPPGGGDGAGAAEQQRLPAFWQDSPGVC